MTNKTKTPRTPSGAAVAGSQNRPVQYPRQLVIMATDAQADWIERMSTATGASKSEVGRALIDAGIAKADEAGS